MSTTVNLTEHRCPKCGYEWLHGWDGSHNCADVLLRKPIFKAMKVVEQLQGWIEDRDGLSSIPIANLNYSEHTLSICIGDICVYDETHSELELEFCKNTFLDYISDYAPFADEVKKRQEFLAKIDE